MTRKKPQIFGLLLRIDGYHSQHVAKQYPLRLLAVVAARFRFIARIARSGHGIPSENPRRTSQNLLPTGRKCHVQLDFYFPSHLARALSRSATRRILGHGVIAEYVHRARAVCLSQATSRANEYSPKQTYRMSRTSLGTGLRAFCLA